MNETRDNTLGTYIPTRVELAIEKLAEERGTALSDATIYHPKLNLPILIRVTNIAGTEINDDMIKQQDEGLPAIVYDRKPLNIRETPGEAKRLFSTDYSQNPFSQRIRIIDQETQGTFWFSTLRGEVSFSLADRAFHDKITGLQKELDFSIVGYSRATTTPIDLTNRQVGYEEAETKALTILNRFFGEKQHIITT